MISNNHTLVLATILGAMVFSGAMYFTTRTPDSAIPQHIVHSFAAFKTQYKRAYATEAEHNFRLSVFHDNLKAALEHNAKKLGSTHGVTKFSDLTKDEFKKQYLGFKPNPNRVRPPQIEFTNKQGDDGNIDVNWVNHESGCVSAVKDQGQCGSCWAFSALEAIETAQSLATGQPAKRLSAQQIVSCDRSDLGCNGGDTITAYQYVMRAGGLESEDDYRYTSGRTGATGRCNAEPTKFKTEVTGIKTVSSNAAGEAGMMQQITKTPMSVCVAADAWQTYRGGIMTARQCGYELDHCVQAVGLVKNQNQPQGNHWLLRNSWGTDWGLGGYIQVETDRNACGLA